ncbi:DNA utilization protein GntX [Scandinavium sp. TWS1a]|uniref:DNA utilization protein GntX n=1 Tax=Scandinavium tedordense TaxID=2926521 RepID=UPI0021652FCB|nr:DNA utilization protein GntX [Scandinavium tedordense]MCS2171150.1 DNA utilization protein GntX [Scandinavium tedordense]
MLTAHGLCWLCQMPLALAHWGVCSRCARAVSSRLPVCPRCGLPAAGGQTDCGRCLQRAPPWQSLVAVNDYGPPLSTLVKTWKFSARPELARTLGRLLLLRLRQYTGRQKPDRLLAVPLWQRRHWQRGYNQADLLCRPLAHWLGISYQPEAIRRVMPTATQHQLSARLRKQNLKNAFRIEFPVQGLHIALVDDVVTTGSTVAELSRLLLQNGAASVQVWCLCRTL